MRAQGRAIHSAALRACLPVGLVVFCLGAPARASEAVETQVQDVSRRACKVLQNRQIIPEEHQPRPFSCPPFLGWRVNYVYRGASLTVRFDPPGGRAPGVTAGSGYDLGERIEWRGLRRPEGFQPLTAILRLDWRKGERLRSVLAVIRTEAGWACAAAFVDVQANGGAAELARRVAAEAASFRCGADEPRILGVRTEFSDDALARTR